MAQRVKTPTRVDPPSENLLDLLIQLEDDNSIQDIHVSDPGISDHYLIKATLQCRTQNTPKTIWSSSRNLKKLDLNAFRNELQSRPCFTSPSDDVDIFATQIERDITAVLDNLAPIRKCSRRSSSHLSRLSPSAIQAKQVRRRFERKFKQTGAESDRKAYRAACHKANCEIRMSRRVQYKERLNEAGGDFKETWRIAKELLHQNRKSTDNTSSGNHTSSPQERCNKIGTFFKDKLENIRQTILQRLEPLRHISISFQLPATPQLLSDLSPVTTAEVLKLIHGLKPKTSPLDYLPTHILKLCPDLFAPLITHLANLSFQSGRFPASFKSAQVTPLLKKEGLDPNDPSNLRPISNLITISKILEKLAIARLAPHVTNSANFTPYQSGFRPGHSTETALLKVTNDILSNADNGSATFLFSLDISAAFDVMDHALLVARAKDAFGIAGTALTWLASYLEGRHFFVAMESARSEILPSPTGVPQGSVLGPFLFSMFVSPVSFLIQSFGIQHHQYADDTQLYASISPGSETTANIASCADAVNRWFLENGLLLNPSKTEAIVFGTRQQIAKHSTLQPTFSKTPINPSNSVKILGVKLDSTLSMDLQTADIIRSCNFHLRALRHIRPFLNKETANIIACGIVNSRLDYCNSLLYGTSSKNITSLQRIQNNLARVVSNSPYRASSKPLLNSLHWLPVLERITYKISVITYKCITTKTPSYLSDLLQNHIPQRNMRSSGNRTLVLHRCRTSTASKSFLSSAPRIWNNLPPIIRNCSSLHTFKTKLKTELYTKANLD